MIDYSQLRSLTARTLISTLIRDGFQFDRQRGSHHRYRHADGRQVTVPFTRAGDTFAVKTLKTIIENQAHWTAEDLRRLGIL